MTKYEMVDLHHHLYGHELSKFSQLVMEAWHTAVLGITKSRTPLSD